MQGGLPQVQAEFYESCLPLHSAGRGEGFADCRAPMVFHRASEYWRADPSGNVELALWFQAAGTEAGFGQAETGKSCLLLRPACIRVGFAGSITPGGSPAVHLNTSLLALQALPSGLWAARPPVSLQRLLMERCRADLPGGGASHLSSSSKVLDGSSCVCVEDSGSAPTLL